MGERGEAVLRIDRFDQLAIKRHDAEFDPEPIHACFAADTATPTARTMSPRTYADAVFCQLVQVIRAIQLGEAPAADADSGRACIAALESALAMAKPLEVPWLDPREQSAYRSLHWSRTA
jgi:hypothetical protein